MDPNMVKNCYAPLCACAKTTKNHKEFFYPDAKHIFPEEAVEVVMHQPAAWKESRRPDRQRAACPPDICVTPHAPPRPPNISDLNPARQRLTHRSPCVRNVSGWSLRRVSRFITAASIRPLNTRSNKPRSIDLDCLLLLLLLFLGGQLDLSAFNQNVEL